MSQSSLYMCTLNRPINSTKHCIKDHYCTYAMLLLSDLQLMLIVLSRVPRVLLYSVSRWWGLMTLCRVSVVTSVVSRVIRGRRWLRRDVQSWLASSSPGVVSHQCRLARQCRSKVAHRDATSTGRSRRQRLIRHRVGLQRTRCHLRPTGHLLRQPQGVDGVNYILTVLFSAAVSHPDASHVSLPVWQVSAMLAWLSETDSGL